MDTYGIGQGLSTMVRTSRCVGRFVDAHVTGPAQCKRAVVRPSYAIGIFARTNGTARFSSCLFLQARLGLPFLCHRHIRGDLRHEMGLCTRTWLQLACTIGAYMETCGTEQSPCECALVQLSYAIGDRMEGFDLGAGFCKRNMVQLSSPR